MRHRVYHYMIPKMHMVRRFGVWRLPNRAVPYTYIQAKVDASRVHVGCMLRASPVSTPIHAVLQKKEPYSQAEK